MNETGNEQGSGISNQHDSITTDDLSNTSQNDSAQVVEGPIPHTKTENQDQQTTTDDQTPLITTNDPILQNSTDDQTPVTDVEEGGAGETQTGEAQQEEGTTSVSEPGPAEDMPPKRVRRSKKDEKLTMANIMAGFQKEKRPLASILIVFLIVPMLSILIAPTFEEEEVKAFGDNEESYVNPFIYLLLIIVFTFTILMIVKYLKKDIIQYIILGAFFVTMIYAFYPLLTYVVSDEISVAISFLLSGVLTYLLVVHPEWYVVDATGIAVAVGVTSIVGISFAPGPILVLMIILAVYDAISVYKTKHMIDLADSVMEFNLPVLLVVPKSKDYSFMKKKGLKEQLASGEERDALFIGLGDIIFPSAFAVSVSVYLGKNLDCTNILGMNGVAFVVAGIIIGTIIGYLVLMAFVLRGRPQAGLPLLNGGAILGYLVPVLAIYGSLGL